MSLPNEPKSSLDGHPHFRGARPAASGSNTSTKIITNQPQQPGHDRKVVPRSLPDEPKTSLDGHSHIWGARPAASGANTSTKINANQHQQPGHAPEEPSERVQNKPGRALSFGGCPSC